MEASRSGEFNGLSGIRRQRRLRSEADWVNPGSRGGQAGSGLFGELQVLSAALASGLTATATIAESAMQPSSCWLEGSFSQKENVGRQGEVSPPTTSV
jgi:hypothetical protein